MNINELDNLIYTVVGWIFIIIIALIIITIIYTILNLNRVQKKTKCYKINGSQLDFQNNKSDVGYGNKQKSVDSFENNVSNNNPINKRIIPGKKEEFYNEKTGRFQKEILCGNRDTDYSVDKETGKFQKHDEILGLAHETGKRINFEDGKIYKDTIIVEIETGTRINQKTGEIEKDGVFGFRGTGERTNPETGKREEEGLFGWKEKK